MYVRKNLRRLIAAPVVFGTLIFPPQFDNFNFVSTVQAEVKTYTGEGEATMGESETLEKVIERAKKYAMRDAIEKAGVYIRSHSELHNSELDDKILTLAGGVVKVIDSDKEIVSKDNAVKVLATVTITIDTDDLRKEIDKYFEKNTQKVKIEISQEKIENKTPSVDNVKLSEQKINEAIKLCDKGKFQEALPICKEAMKLDSNNYKSYEVLGWIYNGLGNHNEAISVLNKCLKINSKSGVAYERLAWSYRGLKDYNRALNYCDKAIEVQPNWIWTYSIRGHIYYDLKNYSKAIADFDKVLQAVPNSSEYIARGWLYYDLKNYSQAISDFKKALELAPDNIWCYDALGGVYNRIGEYNKALEILQVALQMNSNNHCVLEKIGATYMLMKQYQKAISYCDKSIKIKPNDRNYFWAYVTRGKCYQALENYKKANEDFAKARELGWNE